jgi:hypothetical protein
MRTTILALVATVGSSCATPQPIVTDVRIDGYDLVFERCTNPNGFQDDYVFLPWRWGNHCSTSRSPLPVVAPRIAEPRADAEHAATYRALAAGRDALEHCAATSAVHGLVRAILTIDAGGYATAAKVEPDDPELARCTVASFASTVFRVRGAATTVAFYFRVPEVVSPR